MKVAVGLSGGVDSAVAVRLLQEAGHEVVGVTMTLGRPNERQTVEDARAAAERLGVPLHLTDLSSAFRAAVLDDLRREYGAGRTPNPCVRCNEAVKFGLLPCWAFAELGCDRFATGHYARLTAGPDGAPRLMRAKDRRKDQSYFLYRVSREVLSRTLLPLGEMTKDEVRELARGFSLAAAERADSQDFCVGDVRDVVAAAPREGEIVTRDGRVLGRHRGFWNYTVGMRKGLGVGGGTPYYVLELDAAANRVIVGTREETVCRELALRDCVGEIDFSLPVKVRSAGEPRLLKDGISGVAPGQSAVFYRGEEVVGGGFIA